jgi:hypothetical protein
MGLFNWMVIVRSLRPLRIGHFCFAHESVKRCIDACSMLVLGSRKLIVFTEG